MRLIDLNRRLAQFEATGRDGISTMIPSDWQVWVADGIGRVHQGVLCIADPEITPDAWAARFVIPPRRWPRQTPDAARWNCAVRPRACPCIEQIQRPTP